MSTQLSQGSCHTSLQLREGCYAAFRASSSNSISRKIGRGSTSHLCRGLRAIWLCYEQATQLG